VSEEKDKKDEGSKPAGTPEGSPQPKAATDEKPDTKGEDTPQPQTREDALNWLRGDAADLNSVRSRRIISDVIDRVGDAVTVNLFQGDFSFEGDFVDGSGGGRRTSRRRGDRTRVDSAQLTGDLDLFCQPPGFDAGVDQLDSNNLLFFAGQAHTGRRTRALASLAAVLRRNEMDLEIYQVRGNVLGNAGWRAPQRRCGLLFVDRSRSEGKPAAESVSDKWLTDTAAMLRANECFLAVVTGPVGGTLATAAHRTDHVLDYLELPDPMEIVRGHVLGELPWLSEDDITARIAATELADVLDERDEPRFAVRVAKAVADALRTDADLAQVVAKLRDPEDEIRAWLGSEPDLTDIAFNLATATLEGSSFLKVADAAVTLYRELNSGGNGAMMPRYLRKLMSERTLIEIGPPPDDSDGPQVLRFRHSGMRQAVLAQVWSELDGARRKVLEWLNKLAEDTDVEIRARAAGTAGILAAGDFEHGLHKYLLPWGRASSWPLRQSAALGLNVAGSVGSHADAVWTHVEQWAEQARHSTKARNLPMTAALAAGGPLGVADPQRALRVLRVLVCDGDDWGFLESAALSTVTLLEAGRVRPVLKALLDWTDYRVVNESVEKALNMFTYAAGESGEAGSTTDDRPLLLASAGEFVDELAELWGRALSCEPVRSFATDTLETWVRSVDSDPALAKDVLVLVAGIAERGDDDFARVCHALRTWAEDQDDPSASAADFHHQLLVEAGEPRA
jgi:hypothetical protein